MSENATSEKNETNENAANDRPRDRHLGTRENIWFPADEHAAIESAKRDWDHLTDCEKNTRKITVASGVLSADSGKFDEGQYTTLKSFAE